MNRGPNLGKDNFSKGNSLPAETHPHDSVQQEGDAKTTICDFSGGNPGLTAAPQSTWWLRGTAAVICSSSKPRFISAMANCTLLGLTKMWWLGWNERLTLPADASHEASLSSEPFLTRPLTPLGALPARWPEQKQSPAASLQLQAHAGCSHHHTLLQRLSSSWVF